MYRFVNINDDSSGGADPVAKSINTQTQAINNMGKTINGIAQTVVNLKNLALLQYKPVGTKISVVNNAIQFNEPSFLQIIWYT